MKLARKRFEASIPSVAMGDIAFLLLIFFVILARSTDDSHVTFTPAVANEVETAAAPRASVAIDSDFRLFLNGRETDPSALAENLKAILGEIEPGKRTVFLKVDRNAKAKHFEPAIEAISAAGGDLVHVLDPKKEE